MEQEQQTSLKELIQTRLQSLKPKDSQMMKSQATYKCTKCKDTGRYFYKDDRGIEFVKVCECGFEAREVMNRRLRFANIPDKYKDVRFDNYDLNIFSGADAEKINKAFKAVKYYFEHFEEMKEQGRGLYLFSPCKGSGKTRLAISLANELIYNKNQPVKFATSLQILNEIKNTWNNDTQQNESQLLDNLITTDVLIIDDFGTEKSKDWITERFYHIINGRYVENKITILTSNYDLESIDYDDRITDRLSEKSYKIPFPNRSVRQLKAKNDNLDFMMQFM